MLAVGAGSAPLEFFSLVQTLSERQSDTNWNTVFKGR